MPPPAEPRDGWLNQIVGDAKASVEDIAKREVCSVRQGNMTISLAFLAPDLVKAALDCRLPRGIGVTQLRDAPPEWSRQFRMLGLTVIFSARPARNGFESPRE